MRPVQRQKSQNYGQKLENVNEKQQLQEEIKKQRLTLERTDYKIQLYKKELHGFVESNQRNAKRLLKYKMKFEQLHKHRNSPQHFLSICGFMNEYMQEFMLSHDFNVMNVAQEPNPDHMSYQQLLQLGQSIGKVSKGISKLQFSKLQRSNKFSEQSCPICCTEITKGQVVVLLNCKHIYHEQCIMQWLKEQNICPICKKHVLG